MFLCTLCSLRVVEVGVVLASSSLRIAAGATLDQLSTYIHLSLQTLHNSTHNHDHSDLLTDRRAMDVPANLPNPL